MISVFFYLRATVISLKLFFSYRTFWGSSISREFNLSRRFQLIRLLFNLLYSFRRSYFLKIILCIKERSFFYFNNLYGELCLLPFFYLILYNFRKERNSTLHENSIQKGGVEKESVEKEGVQNKHVQKENVHVTRKIHQSFVTENPQLFTTTSGMAHHNSIL